MSLELTPEQVSQAKSLLAVLQKKFPKTFMAQPVKPLKLNIHKELHRALEQRYSHRVINHALKLYTEDPLYFKALVLGTQRIDLAGQSCGEVTEEHIKIAQEMVIRRKHREEQVIATGESASQSEKQRPTLGLKKKISVCKPGNLFKVIWRPKKVENSLLETESQKPTLLQPPKAPEEPLTSGKLGINIKLNVLPEKTHIVKNGWHQFLVETERHKVKLTIRPRTWRKLQQSASYYGSWTAFITGKIGSRIKGGFEMIEPAIQIFECKNK